MNISKLNLLLPFIHLKSNFSNFNNPQVFKFYERCFLMLKKKKKCLCARLQIFNSFCDDENEKKKTNKTKTMSNLTLKIVPMF